MMRRAWALCWPIMLSNLSIPALGVVDTAIMGHLPNSRYLAAVAIGSSLFATLYWTMGFLKAGTTGLASHLYGRHDVNANRTLVLQALIVSAIIGMAFVLIQRPLLTVLHRVFTPPVDTVVAVDAYYRIRIWGVPAALMTLVLMGWYVGGHNTRVPLILSIVINLVNALLNVIFVLGLRMNADGVALGTVMSEYVGLLLGLYFVRRSFRQLPGCVNRGVLCAWRSYVRLLSINGDYFIRTLFLMFTFVFFTRQSALMGQDTLAANEILKLFLLFIALALDGYANAVSALAGSAWSARHQGEFQECVRVLTVWAVLTALALTVLFGAGGTVLLSWLTDLPQVFAIAQQYLWWIVAMPLISMWCFILDGIFIGTTETRYMRNNMIIAVLAIFLPVWWFSRSYGNHGLWLSMLFFFASRGVGLGWVFYRRYWAIDWSVADGVYSLVSKTQCESKQL